MVVVSECELIQQEKETVKRMVQTEGWKKMRVKV